jgi:hypothetical protein
MKIYSLYSRNLFIFAKMCNLPAFLFNFTIINCNFTSKKMWFYCKSGFFLNFLFCVSYTSSDKSIRRHFTAHNSPHTIHRTQFTIHRGEIHRAQFTVHNSPRTIHRGTIPRTQFTEHNSRPSQFIASTIHHQHNSQFTEHNSAWQKLLILLDDC